MISTRLASLAAACIIGGASTVASAALVPYTFTITGGSSLAVGGQFGGNTPNPQPGTTLSTNYTGTIAVEIDHAANLIYFPGGSQLNASNQPNNVAPRTDSTPGSQPGNYGREGTVNRPPFPPIFGTEAIRNLRLDVETAVQGTPTPYNPTTGQFANNSIGIMIDQGTSDYMIGDTTGGEAELASNAFSFNQAATASTLTSNGTTETLTLRLQSGSFLYTVGSSNDSSVSFGGTIIATRTIVPEPASLAVLGLGGLSLLARRRRRA
jgi:hypothetical protein